MARKAVKAGKSSGSLLDSIQDTFRRALSCCGPRKKRLVIQAPTDFRREEVKFDMSSMNADQRAFIRSLTFINTTPVTITPSTQHLTTVNTPPSHFSSTTTSPASTPCPTPAQLSPSRMDRVLTRTTRRLSVHIPHVASPLRPVQSAYQAVEDHNSTCSTVHATPAMQSHFESDSSEGTRCSSSRCSEDSRCSRASFESLELNDGKSDGFNVKKTREDSVREGCCCGDSVCDGEQVDFEKEILRKMAGA